VIFHSYVSLPEGTYYTYSGIYTGYVKKNQWGFCNHQLEQVNAEMSCG
jgi:hypothetical protein